MTDTIQILGTILFALAVLHTFSIKVFQHLALKFPEGSVQENLFHLLGEVEIVFGLWAGFLVATWARKFLRFRKPSSTRWWPERWREAG